MMPPSEVQEKIYQMLKNADADVRRDLQIIERDNEIIINPENGYILAQKIY